MNYWPAETTNCRECHAAAVRRADRGGRSRAPAPPRSTTTPAAGSCITTSTSGAARRPSTPRNHGIWPTGGAWLASISGGTTSTLAISSSSAKRYPLMKGAALFFVDYLVPASGTARAGSSPGPSNSPEQGGLVMGPTMDHQIIRDLFGAARSPRPRCSDVDPGLRDRLTDDARADRARPDRPVRTVAGVARGHGRPEDHHRHVSHLWGLHPGDEITASERPSCSPPRGNRSSFRGDDGTGLAHGLEDQFLGAAARRRPRLQMIAAILVDTTRADYAHGRRDLREPVRRPSALPDRRQLRRDRRHRRDAPAEPRRRDRTSARAPIRLAKWKCAGPSRARRIHRRRDMEGRHARECGHLLAARRFSHCPSWRSHLATQYESWRATDHYAVDRNRISCRTLHTVFPGTPCAR